MLGSDEVGYPNRRVAGTLSDPSEVPTRPMALLQPLASPESDAYHLAAHRIKRCTFRRLIQVDGGVERTYEVECLYPERHVPIPLGDLDSAMPICNTCTAAHIFRPDED